MGGNHCNEGQGAADPVVKHAEYRPQNMLKIVGRAGAPSAYLELDPHLPFLLCLGEATAPGQSLIWYCKPDDRSIFKDDRLCRVDLAGLAPNKISRIRRAVTPGGAGQ